MAIVFRGLSPHPPILIPQIGQNDLEQVEKTVKGMESMAKVLKKAAPEVIMFTTPHGLSFRDSFSFIRTPKVEGDFGEFGFSQIKFSLDIDLDLTDAIMKEAEAQGIEVIAIDQGSKEKYGVAPHLDHGVMVPLFYIQQAFDGFSGVIVSTSGLSRDVHRRFGEVIMNICGKYDKRVALLGSGDLSHRLTESAPAGFHPEAYLFDEALMKCLAELNAEGIKEIPEKLIRRAGECGLKSVHILLGSLGEEAGLLKPKVHSYEGPFGVGYGVFSVV